MENEGEKLILIGEDDVDDQEIIAEVFASIDANLQLQFINNGRKLVHYVQNLKPTQLPCLIILDYNMPELNGAEILIMLQDIPGIRNIPRIIWSTSIASAYKSRCMELGASDYFLKPSKISVLEEMARHMLSFCA